VADQTYPYADGVAFVISQEAHMVAVLVRFRYESGFSEARVRQVAEAARAKFEGMPELRSKAFTIDPVNQEAINFYVWVSSSSLRRESN
jgi:hypothetical protein